MSEKIYTTRELAILCSSSKKTIRHYKKIGLIEPSYVDGNGYWYFNQEDLERMDTIQQLKLVDFSLDEIKKIIESQVDINELINEKLSQIEEEIDRLKRSKSILASMESTQELKGVITDSMFKEHSKWVDSNMTQDALKLFEIMRSKGHDDQEHIELAKLLRLCKVPIFNNDDSNLLGILRQIDSILGKYLELNNDKKTVLSVMTKIMQEEDTYTSGYSNQEASRLFSKYEELLLEK